MNEPEKHPDADNDPLLATWLREAAEDRLGDIADPIARVRKNLLERIAECKSPARRLIGAWARHRLAIGSIAASVALAGALLVALNSGVPLSAMERMAKELKEITSYSYQSVGSNAGIDDDGRRETRKNDTTVSWMSGDGFHTETKIVKIVEDLGGGNPTETILAHFAEVFPPGKPGVFIDHQYKTFFRQRYDPLGSNMYPHDYIRMIREGSYDVLGDLGTKQVGEKTAHGVRLLLKNPHDEENLVRDPVELWVDPQTDLPVEIRWSGETEGWKYADITNDFRWNVPIDKKRFELDIPPDYADITPPTEKQDLDQIAATLRLFAELSGGHYPGGLDPREKKFNPRRIHDGMLKIADYSTAADSAARAEKHREIEKALAGLNWIARILRNRYHSGYRGTLVGPTDKDQVLLWFLDPATDGYRVFYGDLRTAVMTAEEKSKLVPKHEVVGVPQSEDFPQTSEPANP